MFYIANFLSVKISLDAPKIMFLDTYQICFNALLYAHSVRGNKQDAEGTGTTTSAVLKLYSSYTDPFGIAEFNRIG